MLLLIVYVLTVSLLMPTFLTNLDWRSEISFSGLYNYMWIILKLLVVGSSMLSDRASLVGLGFVSCASLLDIVLLLHPQIAFSKCSVPYFTHVIFSCTFC